MRFRGGCTLKRKKEKLKMSEEIKETEVTETVEKEQVDTQEPTVTVAEMKRRIAKEQENAQKQIDDLNQSMDDRIKEAVEEAQKKAQMTGKELQKYKEQQAEQEKQKLLDQIKELELKNTRRELKDEAIKTLSERKLPVNEKVLNFVVKDTAEDTLSAIDDMSEIIKDIKNEFASSEAPLTSGGIGASDNNTDIFNILDNAGK